MRLSGYLRWTTVSAGWRGPEKIGNIAHRAAVGISCGDREAGGFAGK
jgi:hypothetical protein